jgi:hypothetical protein
MYDYVVLVPPILAAIYVVWDLGQRHISARRDHEALLDRMAAQDREIEKLGMQQQQILQKLNAAVGATVTRLPRRGSAS